MGEMQPVIQGTAPSQRQHRGDPQPHDRRIALLSFSALLGSWTAGRFGQKSEGVALNTQSFELGVQMKQILLAFAVSLVATALADTIGFDQDPTGTIPAGWTCGVTGRGSPRWAVEADSSAPSKPNVLKQSGQGTFPWCAKRDVRSPTGLWR